MLVPFLYKYNTIYNKDIHYLLVKPSVLDAILVL